MKRLLGLLLAVLMVMMGGISCAVAENANPIVSDWLTELILFPIKNAPNPLPTSNTDDCIF